LAPAEDKEIIFSLKYRGEGFILLMLYAYREVALGRAGKVKLNI
jgi:hypothetical protein